MQLQLQSKKIQSLCIITFLLISGCTIKLAPNYDSSLVTGINSVNMKTLELFSNVSEGTKSDTPEQKAQKIPIYDSIIGSLDALTAQSKARVIPDNKFINAFKKSISNRYDKPFIFEGIPSVHSLSKASAAIRKMKKEDLEKGLGKSSVDTIKGIYDVSMDQALFYETFLKR